LDSILSVEQFIGRAKEQTEEFLYDIIRPILEENASLLGMDVSISV
jgi:adenylosuccinate lyase